MLKVEQQKSVLTLTLNRPDVRNAFNAELISALTAQIKIADDSESVRVVLIKGEGKNFSAGADLNWMLGMKEKPMDENVEDAKSLATLMYSLNRCRKPVVVVAQGAVMGGGVGLAACADIVVASDDAFFALSETKLGLTPATISPFVVNAIGARQARRYMLTGERFTAQKALSLGLVHEVVAPQGLEEMTSTLVNSLLTSAPYSHPKIKKLVRDVSERKVDETLMENLSWRIANQRVSEEGREGIEAFLEKRPPNWTEREDA
jgi:methylglutaconyl-CoA hydratase